MHALRERIVFRVNAKPVRPHAFRVKDVLRPKTGTGHALKKQLRTSVLRYQETPYTSAAQRGRYARRRAPGEYARESGFRVPSAITAR